MSPTTLMFNTIIVGENAPYCFLLIENFLRRKADGVAQGLGWGASVVETFNIHQIVMSVVKTGNRRGGAAAAGWED